MTDSQYPPAWHVDPVARHQQRYWDGSQWTEHVSNNGVQSVDLQGKDMANTPQKENSGIIDGEVFSSTTSEQVQAQVAKARKAPESIIDAVTSGTEKGNTAPEAVYDSIFNQHTIVVNQKAKILELSSEYGVFNEQGQQIAAVRQVGQSTAKKAARAVLNVDQFMTHTLDIVDMTGALQLRIVKPRALVVPKVNVLRADGTVLGQLALKFRIGKAQIKMIVDNQQIGMIYSENFRAWNFKIQDAQSRHIASIAKTWEGFARAMFTTADNYVIQIHENLSDPLHSMVLGSSLAIDLILKQQGGSGF